MPRLYLVIIIATAFLFASPAAAQSTFATLTGTITDAAGAAIPGATIEATHVQTNYVYTGQSNESGVYVLAQLRDGAYIVRVRSAGLKEYVARDVQLAARDLRRLDVRMELGQVETTIEVSGGATLIETETARITDSREAGLLRRLPLNTRSPLSLAIQTAGVYVSQGTSVSTYRFAGSRSNQQDYAVDGISVSARDSSVVSPQMSYLESVQELRVDMANNTAEFGAIGQLTIISKSGGNRLSGSLFDYYSSTAFQARNPFSLVRPSQVVHEPGGSLGGPVYLPKIYNGKNKTFFFATYETGRGGATGNTWRNTYAPSSWRAGDFSSLSTVVRDPTTGLPFPGNRIPTDRLNPVSLKIQDRYFPLPNVGSPDAFGANNFFQLEYLPFNTRHMWTTRVDHRFSSKAFVFGRFSWTRNPSNAYEPSLPTIDELRFRQRDTRQLALSYTHTITPTLLNEFRYGYAYTDDPRWGPVNGRQAVQDLGLIGLADDLPDLHGIPNVSWSGLGLTGLTQQAECAPCFLNRVHQFQDHVSWVRGRHNAKFGAAVKRVTSVSVSQGNLFGALTFSNRFTGHEYGDFLLGIPTTAARSFPAIGDWPMWNHYSAFATDDFKINSRLTLNMGVRYEYTPGFKSTKDYLASFDIKTGKIVVPDGMLGSVSPLLPRGYVDVIEASQAGFRNTYLIDADRNNFAPRIGIAYRPWGDKTVFRGGYGIFYDVTAQRLDASSPFQIAEPAFTNPAGNPVVILPNVFPQTGVGGPSTLSLAAAFDPQLVMPYSMQYSLTVEHQRWNNALRLSYIGTNTRQGIYQYNVNQPVPDARPYVDKPRLFPQYPAITYVANGAGHQYHSLTAEVRRNFSNGLAYDFSWVWARDIGDLEQRQAPENAFDRARERGVWQDIPTHRITSHLIYQLPFGKGKPLASRNRVLNAVISGWEMSAIYIRHSGEFLTPLWTGPDPTGTVHTTSRTPANVTLRPDQLRDPNLPSGQRSVERWFDVGAFAPPAAGSFGSASRGAIIGPGVNLLHGGIAREFRLSGERARLRCELTATNALNHPNWSAPGANISTLGTAGVITSASGAAGTSADSAGPRGLRAGVRIDF